MAAEARHDFRGGAELVSFQPEPLEAFAQAEQLAQRTFGSLAANIRTPETRYMCTWRDADRFNATSRPLEPFLVCSFSPEFIPTQGSLLEMAEVHNTIDRALLRATWRLEGEEYTLQHFTVELQVDGQAFRSVNRHEEVYDIQVLQYETEFPASNDDVFHFTLRSKLPERYNSGDEQGEPLVTVVFSGIAQPTPDWVNY